MSTITVNYRLWNEFISWYCIVLAVFGTIGNFIAFSICMRKSLRCVPTFVFLAFMTIVDTFSLYYWNLNNYFLTYFSKTIADFSDFNCKFTSFLQFFFSQASPSILIALALERYLSVKIKNWRNSKFNSKKAAIVSSIIVLFYFILNVHILDTLNLVLVANKSALGACYGQPMYRAWRMYHTYSYSIIPFAIILLINCLLIYEVVQTKKNIKLSDGRSVNKNVSMSVSIIIHTMVFIVLTGPLAISGGYFLSTLQATELGRIILYSCSSAAFTFHGFDLIILLISNKKFRHEFRAVLIEFKILKRNHIGITTMTNTEGTQQRN